MKLLLDIVSFDGSHALQVRVPDGAPTTWGVGLWALDGSDSALNMANREWTHVRHLGAVDGESFFGQWASPLWRAAWLGLFGVTLPGWLQSLVDEVGIEGESQDVRATLLPSL